MAKKTTTTTTKKATTKKAKGAAAGAETPMEAELAGVESVENPDARVVEEVSANFPTPHIGPLPLEATDDTRQITRVEPDAIIVDPQIKALRDWNGATEQEMEIGELANSILDEGQMQPGIGWEREDGVVLIVGQRRLEAVRLLRSQGHDILFDIIVDPLVKSEQEAFRKALHENMKRANFNDMETVSHIELVRDMFNLRGPAGTVGVAEYLGVDPATVTQLERLRKLPEGIQAEVRAGRMTRTAALDYLVTPTEKVGEVHQLAVEEAKKRVSKKKAATVAKGKKTEADRLFEASIGKDKKRAKEKTGTTNLSALAETSAAVEVDKEEPEEVVQVTSADVRKAQAKVVGGTTKLRAPKMSEAVSVVDEWAAGDYPQVMIDFALTFSAWAHAKASGKKLREAWEDIADAIPAMGKGKAATPPILSKKTGAKVKVKTGAKTAKTASKKPAKATKKKSTKSAKK